MSQPAAIVLEARLDAHRRVLSWMLGQITTTSEQQRELMQNLDQSLIPQDHQEDPGAVPDDAFAANAAYDSEMLAIVNLFKKGSVER